MPIFLLHSERNSSFNSLSSTRPITYLSYVTELSRMSPKVLDKLILMSRGCNSLRDIADIMNAHVSSAAEIVPAEEDVENGLAGGPISTTTAI